MKKRFSVSAVIFDKRGRVLSIGKNSYIKTHPLQAEYARRAGEPHKVYLHAEVDAIVKCSNLDRAEKIVVFRHTEDGSPASARPCKICQHAIKLAGIKNVEHT